MFDDSKLHYANNPTDKERVVLIFDIEEKFSFILFIYTIIKKIKLFFNK